MRYNRSTQYFVYAIVLLFPILSNLFEHACSSLFFLFTLMGLPLCFSKKKRPLISFDEKMVMWAFVSYFGVYLFSYMVNGILGNLEDPRIKFIEHELRMLLIIPIFFLFRKVRLPASMMWYSVVLGAILSGVYAIIFGVILFPGERVSGSYHAISFGDLSLAMAFMSMAGVHFFQQKKNIIWTIFPWFAFIMGLVASMLSGTRGAWIAIPVLFLIAFFQYYKDLRFRTWIGIIVGICLVVVFLYKSPYTNIAERLHGTYQEFVEYDSSNVKDGSTTERLEGWHAAWNIFLEHPFLGAGPGSFKPIVHRMIDQGERSEIIRRFSQPHNAYLAVMADCGIPSLISLFAIFLIPAYTIVKQILMDRTGRDAGFAGLYLIAAFAQFGLTETIFGRNINIGFYIVMLAVVLSVSTGYDGVKSIIPPNHTASSRD